MKKEQDVELPRFRLVVLGSAKCGKSSIIRRFLYNEYRDAYRETVEDLLSKNFVVKVGIF
jgi:GTPase SAR1 family protein